MFTSRQESGLAPIPAWLESAVFYEIYPQSFCDTNRDGIGDLKGIKDNLDYIASLGATALWINPCFESPFKDAGYDVADYTSIAPRYGSNEDLVKLVKKAHKRGIKVLLDLVPGHTSEEHPWFQKSKLPERNEYTDRYIWTSHAFDNGAGLPFIGGEAERDATYVLNFFKCQPALNYGFNPEKIDREWQQLPTDRGPMATREAMVEIIRFWLDKGVDGFRVDMADSLVKLDGEEKEETIEVWRDIFSRFRADYPEAAFVSEWGKPWQALAAGFDMDFYLDWRHNGANQLSRDTEDQLLGPEDKSFFRQSSQVSARGFIGDYLPQYEKSKELGYFSFISGNHDTPRLAPRLSEDERRLFFTFLLTMPGVPFIYYGDEIGMRYQKLPTVEGGYHRTGSRTPMQWDAEAKNLGFSAAKAKKLYTPVDASADAPTVAGQEKDPDSLLNFIRKLVDLRKEHTGLQAPGEIIFFNLPDSSRVLAYRRFPRPGQAAGAGFVVALNPGTETEILDLGHEGEIIFAVQDPSISGNALTLPPLSGAIIRVP